jgi:hypothetical protein
MKKFPTIRRELSEGLQVLENDDLSYFYHQDHLQLHKGFGFTCSEMQQFRGHDNFDFTCAMIRVLALARNEDCDLTKLAFVVLDDQPDMPLVLRQIARGFNWDVAHNIGCWFYFLDIGTEKPTLRELCEKYPRAEYQIFQHGKGIGAFIQEITTR